MRQRIGRVLTSVNRAPPTRLLSSFHRQAPHTQDSVGWWLLGAAAVVGGIAAVKLTVAQSGPAPVPVQIEVKSNLPDYSKVEIAKHKTKETGIWVYYKNAVYDITNFVAMHPGGLDKIMMAAGGSIAPFWAMYAQHNTDEVRKMLEQYRIGNLVPSERESSTAPSGPVVDPYKDDPHRHPALRVVSDKPFNAEAPTSMLSDFITPNDLFFVRNHLPVPHINAATFKLKVNGEGVRELELSLDDLKRLFKRHTIVATLQCSGNRRSEMNAVKPVKGLDWQHGAISNATWSGVLLRDVLLHAGLDEKDSVIRHIQFEGMDKDLAQTHYGASIPIQTALNPANDVLLAFEMNGEPVPLDHGFPLRVVVPGNVGARSVKWLGKITASREESQSHWQQKDYKSFSPSVDWDNVDWKSAPAIQEYPIQSAITEPKPNIVLPSDSDEVTVKGYAWSGSGKSIIRVDVSPDGGKTWHVAQLKPGKEQLNNRAWAWTPWQATLPVPSGGEKTEICAKAVDGSYNQQPENVLPIWNLRGVLTNHWHRVPFRLAPSSTSSSGSAPVSASASPVSSPPTK